MQSFQKPENALKRADELLSVGQQEAALKILHGAIGHRRFRSQGWDSVQETIMIRHVQLCVDENKLRLARDGLHQYRIISQHANIQSLGKVVTELRSRAEQKLTQAKQLASSAAEAAAAAAAADGTAEQQQQQEDGLDEEGRQRGVGGAEANETSSSSKREGLFGNMAGSSKPAPMIASAAAGTGDLDQLAETPEDLLLSTLQIAVRSADARGVHQALRSVWDVYKMILDLLRTTPKLERVYHETARKAFLFCRENARPQEFKRLCDVLRSHFALLVKNRFREEYEQLLRPDLHLETRMLQLVVAADLELWRECAATAEDLLSLGLHECFYRALRSGQELFHRSREKLMRWLAIYYEKMARVTWVADNYLFHALSWLKLLLHVKGYKRNIPQQDLQAMASVVVLAVLAIPLSGLEKKERDDVTAANDVVLFGSVEQQKRMAMLLGHSTLPTREGLKTVLYTKDIVSLADETCQQLLALIESEFTPLKLCALCQPLLDKVAENPALEPYVYPLKKVIFHKLVFQLSRVYATLSIKHFTTHICTSAFLPWSEAEKLFVAIVHQQQQQQAALAQQLAGGLTLAGAAAALAGLTATGSGGGTAAGGHLMSGGQSGLCIRLDYATSAILFETVDAAAAKTLKHQLCNLAKHIDKAVQMVYPGPSAEDIAERKAFLEQLPGRLEAETRRMAERTKITHSRRLEKQEEQQRVEEERRRREAEQRRVEEKQEKERREEATRRREERRMQQEKIKQRSETAAQMLEEIKKIGGKASGTIYIKGKQLDEINIDDVLQGNVDYDDLERAQLTQLNKEKLARQRQRRQNYRRVCHFIRACREEELPLLMLWQEDQLSQDTRILLDMQNKHEEEHKAAFEAALEERQVFEVMKSDKEAWTAERLKERQVEFEQQAKEQRERLLQVLKQQKIQRARVRKEEHSKKMKIEAERKRMEEEQKRYLEQMEKKRQEEEAKARRLAEQAEKQAQREQEIEEKQRQLDREILTTGRSGAAAASIRGTEREQHGSTAVAATPAITSGAALASFTAQQPAGTAATVSAESDDWRRGAAPPATTAVEGSGRKEFSSASKGRREREPRGGAGGDEDFDMWRRGPAASPSSGKTEAVTNSVCAPVQQSARPRIRLAAAAAAVLNEAVAAAPSSGVQQPNMPQHTVQLQQQNGDVLVAPAVASDEGYTTVARNRKK